jgi:hypothetical protein
MMKKVTSLLFVILFVTTLPSSIASAALSPASLAIAGIPPQSSGGAQGLQGPGSGGGGTETTGTVSATPAGFSYTYELLKQTVTLWSDGRGDVILRRKLRNTDIANWSSTTWYFNWYPGNYSNIRAWDAEGPLTITTSQSGSRIDTTVYFRRLIQPSQSYEFSIAITIGGMAWGSGDNWTASWYTKPISPIQDFIQGVTFPSNSTFQSIFPAPTTQHLNYLEWRVLNTPSNWEHTIDVDYRLSNTVTVPLFLQTDSNWASRAYGRYPENDTQNTIGRWGCWMTSAAMMIEYWAQRSSPSFHTNPDVLNTWLRNNNGYDGSNFVVHSAIANYASDNHVSLYYQGRVAGRDDAVLDDYLRSGNPVIIGVTNQFGGHFVLATGKTTIGGQSTYSINDPIYGRTTLLERYSNNYSSIIRYSGTAADPRTLRISAHSPVELVITDPLGRKLGFDPVSNTAWNEIPNAGYMTEQISAADGANVPPLEDKFLEILAPPDGSYSIDVIGTGQGPYEIDSFASDWSGSISRNISHGTAQVDSVHIQSVNFSSYSGLRVFLDVSDTYWARSFIERLYNAGITGGCTTNPLRYCPEATVTRAQMAVFLLRGIHGSAYNPPAVGASTGFGDVPTTYWAAAWIKQLAAGGITGGCGIGTYCPEAPVTRAQMAVFLLRSKHGASYTPPAVGASTGFGDVPPGYWAAAWIKQLVAEGITTGCGAGTYCPEAPVTRAQMAVFLVRTFALP